jgi:hypothetical protein
MIRILLGYTESYTGPVIQYHAGINHYVAMNCSVT